MPSSRTIAASCALSAVLVAHGAAQAPPVLPPVRVDRVLVDARILDRRGRELRDVRPGELRVEIDGKPARIESVEWISEVDSRSADRPAARASAGLGGAGHRREAEGRLLVFLFQKNFEGGRLNGLMRMKERAVEFARGLGPDDHAAVLVFDSHLRLVLDFTSDAVRLQDALRYVLQREEPVEASPPGQPQLAAWLDRDAARKAATPEKGLEVLGRALGALPGPKSLVFFGWGLGRLVDGTVQMEADYEGARRALEDSRTAVFALDVSYADAHSLEVGLKRVAEDTGGFYARTKDFPGVAMDQLAGALRGQYVLALERPQGPRGSHKIAVDLVGRAGTVLARSTYVD